MWRSVLICALVLGGQGDFSLAGADESGLHDCGTNSLYLLLRFSGRRAELGAIQQTLPPRHSAGFSMAELQASARAFGLRLNGVRIGEKDVPLDRPAIAFMNNGAQAISSSCDLWVSRARWCS